MKTKLFINNLEVFANHGLFEEENRLGQNLFLALSVSLIIKRRCSVMR